MMRSTTTGRDKSAAALARKARSMLAPIEDDLVQLLQNLVRTDSVSLGADGNEMAAQQVLADFCKHHQIDGELYDTAKLLSRSSHPLVRRQRNYVNRPNFVVRLGGCGRGRSLLLSGHVDTVPPQPQGWRDGPLSGAVRGGRLYGRGAWDMKGGLAAQFAVAASLKRAGATLAGDLIVESVVDEEWAGGGGTLAGRLRGDNADACCIPEGTGLSVVRATRGGYFVDITASAGDPSAYFSTEEVLNPVLPMGRLLAWVEKWKLRRSRVRPGQTYKDFSDPAPVQVLALEANRFDPHTPWSVPLTARLRIYFQFLPHEDQPAVIADIRRSFDKFVAGEKFFRRSPPKWTPIVEPPLLGHELGADHPWTACMSASASAAIGKPAKVSAAPYPCDAFICQREFGIPTLLFGPSGSGAHNVNECVTLASVKQTARSLLTAALMWCA